MAEAMLDLQWEGEEGMMMKHGKLQQEK